MTPERVRQIVEAYGARADRWPEAERAAALRMIANDDALAWRVREAAALDTMLSCYVVPMPHGAMVGRAMSGVPASPGLSVLRNWWVRLTLAGAGLAGIATGAVALGMVQNGLSDRAVLAWSDEPVTIFAGMDVEEGEL